MALASIALSLLVNSLAAFSLSRLKWRGQQVVLSIIIATLIIPFETIAVPLLLLVSKLGWLNTYHVQVLPFVAGAFSIFLSVGADITYRPLRAKMVTTDCHTVPGRSTTLCNDLHASHQLNDVPIAPNNGLVRLATAP